MTDDLASLLILIGAILAPIYLFFYTIRGWWRVCRGSFLDELVDLCRGWKINVPLWKVPLYFVAFIIGALLSTYLGDLLIRWAVISLLG